ncbi:MAG TPA: DUF4394 domain-containing protein [Candidatus Binatia bacterium]|nr:DUF4394 domain-containing protein [Candidatus Binatia bacterium]
MIGLIVNAWILGLLTAPALAGAATWTLVALTPDGALFRFPADEPGPATRTAVRGVNGALVGIDRRPSNGRLYGVTATGDVYTVDPESGSATLVSTLTLPFDGGTRSGVDFNPSTDRLRLVAHDGQNLRVNVELGAAAADTALSYARNDVHAGARPAIAAAAYTKNVPGAAETVLFDLDAALDLLVRQDPPNDGTLVTVGPLGVDVPPEAGFEIVSGEGGGTGFAAFAGVLYRIDLGTGAATAVGPIGGSPAAIVGLTSRAP